MTLVNNITSGRRWRPVTDSETLDIFIHFDGSKSKKYLSLPVPCTAAKLADGLRELATAIQDD